MSDFYDLKNKAELIQFDADCAAAENACPQVRYCDHELEIHRKEISRKEVFKHWRNNDTLWKYGYHAELSTLALGTFEEHERRKKEKKKL